MLVAGASALFAELGMGLIAHFASHFAPGQFRVDPVRVMQAIVIGVSFLGAGSIFSRDGGRVEGLTTAATILLAAGVGLACALQHFVVALGATFLTLVALRVIKIFEGWRRHGTRSLCDGVRNDKITNYPKSRAAAEPPRKASSKYEVRT